MNEIGQQLLKSASLEGKAPVATEALPLLQHGQVMEAEHDHDEKAQCSRQMYNLVRIHLKSGKSRI